MELYIFPATHFYIEELKLFGDIIKDMSKDGPVVLAVEFPNNEYWRFSFDKLSMKNVNYVLELAQLGDLTFGEWIPEQLNLIARCRDKGKVEKVYPIDLDIEGEEPLVLLSLDRIKVTEANGIAQARGLNKAISTTLETLREFVELHEKREAAMVAELANIEKIGCDKLLVMVGAAHLEPLKEEAEKRGIGVHVFVNPSVSGSVEELSDYFSESTKAYKRSRKELAQSRKSAVPIEIIRYILFMKYLAVSLKQGDMPNGSILEIVHQFESDHHNKKFKELLSHVSTREDAAKLFAKLDAGARLKDSLGSIKRKNEKAARNRVFSV